MKWIIGALVLFIVQLGTILILEFRNPSKAVAWQMILFVFPIVGFVVYFFVAEEYTRRKKVRTGLQMEQPRAGGSTARRIVERPEQTNSEELRRQPRLFSLLLNLRESPITCGNRITVLADAAAAYPAMLQAIRDAKHHIHVEFYTIRDDGAGEALQQALIGKAREGVEVRVIYDGVGSYELSGRYIRQLQDAGIEVHGFLRPLLAFFDRRMNFRNHRKIVVVDGAIGFLGGINIGDEYLGKNPKLGFWRDTHLQVEGEAVYDLQQTFLTDWAFVSGQQMHGKAWFPDIEAGLGTHQAQIIASGPDSHWDSILEVFFSAMMCAKDRIWLTSPYFIPDPGLHRALKTAAISGVDVRIIIPGVPDSRLVQYASLSYVEELLDAGIRFFQYQKGFIHAKVLIVDRLLASVGTSNMDMRSFFSNFEVNAMLFDPDVIERLESDFNQDLADSQELQAEAFLRRPRTQKGKEIAARLLAPLL